MRFKTIRLRRELEELRDKNKSLFDLLIDLDLYSIKNFEKEITVTHIFRTKQEHDDLYKLTLNPPKTSPHMRWEAADIRSLDYTQDQVDDLLSYLNQSKNTNGKPRAIYHKIPGNRFHFHIYVEIIKVLVA